MIKNIVIVVLVLISIFLATYANIKSNEADKNASEALAYQTLAELHYKSSEEQERLATEAAAKALIETRKADEAMEIAQEAQEALAKCEGR